MGRTLIHCYHGTLNRDIFHFDLPRQGDDCGDGGEGSARQLRIAGDVQPSLNGLLIVCPGVVGGLIPVDGQVEVLGYPILRSPQPDRAKTFEGRKGGADGAICGEMDLGVLEFVWEGVTGVDGKDSISKRNTRRVCPSNRSCFAPTHGHNAWISVGLGTKGIGYRN